MSVPDPILLFFLFGVIAGVLRSELRLPSQIYDFISLLLLLTIGLKGGVELSKQPFGDMVLQIAVVALLGIALPLMAYPVLRFVGGFKRPDASSIAAHYGSVSVGTFAVCVAFMASKDIFYEEYMPLFVVVLEIPAILVGIVLARGVSRGTKWGKIAHEVFLGKGVLLLTGGLLIGWIGGSEGVRPLEPLFFDLFKGLLALFLLEMGLIAASQISSLKKYGFFIVIFGVAMPVFSAAVGTLAGYWLGLSIGGTTILATLFASASYIAVPAAMRISVPEANPTLSLAASLGVTFPFNILFGIPLYHEFAVRAPTLLGA